jgi:cytochrome c556
MREWRRLSLATIALTIVVTGTALGAEPADGKAAFLVREETMKRMGRAFYGTIGRVVRGKAELGPDTIAAAETITVAAGTLGGVFAPGSDVAESRIKAQIFAAQPRVEELVRDVQQATGRLLPVVKGGDKAVLASAYAAVDAACEACHREYRKPVE